MNEKNKNKDQKETSISPKSSKKNKENEPQKPPFKPLIIWASVILIALTLYHMKLFEEPTTKELSYTEFKNAVLNERIKSFIITEDSVYGSGEFINSEVYTVNILAQDTSLYQMLQENKVDVVIKRNNTFWSNFMFSIFPPILLVFLLWFFIYRQMRGIGKGALSFGKSKARLMTKDKDKITFAHVAGIEEAKEEVMEIIEFLKDPKKFQKLGGRIPKGVLLVGSPGSGKTLLAKSIAGEADVPFFSLSGSDFVEMFVGVGASRVRDMFEQGKKNAPCIIFMDEIDAVGRHRGSGIGGGHDEREQTLNALLVEMDGFHTDEGVIIIAATNRPDVLDPALLRPGRFDRQIVIDLPDLKGREGILKVHADKIILAKEVELKIIARGTPGFSGADLANLINEAALLAARRNKKAVDISDLEEARDKVKWGRERKSRAISEEDKKITAYHEAGHALVLDLIKEVEPLHKVTIIPRGVAYLGATMQLPEKDKYHETKTELLGEIAGFMGGRIAEEIIFGDITSGARSDIKTSTKLARSMVCKWGMSEKLGPQSFDEREEHIFLGREISRSKNHSEQTAQVIDKEITKIITECYQRARDIITENKDALIRIAEALLEREVLEGKEITQLIRGESLAPLEILNQIKEESTPKEEKKNKNEDLPENSESDIKA